MRLIILLILSTSAAAQPALNHVYSPDRLKIIKADTTITGTVKYVRMERDGDWHILLNNNIVGECICQNKSTIPKVIKACAGYKKKFTHVRAGDVVTMQGPYVWDIKHGWYEVHPIKSLTIKKPLLQTGAIQ